MESLTNLCPIVGWSLGPIKALDSVAIKLDFLPRTTSRRKETVQPQKYVLTIDQAAELADTITRAVQALRIAEEKTSKKSSI
jgi:hypothetical protein